MEMKTGTKRGQNKSKQDRELHLDTVARMDRQGYTGVEIARKLGVTQQLVSSDLKAIHDKFEKSYVYDYRKALVLKLRQIRDIRAEAWEAWERSKKDVEETTQEQALRDVYKQPSKGMLPEEDEVLDGLDKMNGIKMHKEQKLKVTKIIKTVKGRLPNNDYLLTIVKCLEQEAKLEGLMDGDTHIHLNQTNNIQNNNVTVANWWDKLSKQQTAIEADPIEEKIKAIEDMNNSIEGVARVLPLEEEKKAVG